MKIIFIETTSGVSKHKASKVPQNSNKGSSKHESISGLPNEKDFKSIILPDLNSLDHDSSKEILVNDYKDASRIEESKRKSKSGVVDVSTTEYAPYVGETEKSLDKVLKSSEKSKSKRSVAVSALKSKMSKSIKSGTLSALSRHKTIEEAKQDGYFAKFKPKKSIGLSVITHTPTEKSQANDVALSAITHTPSWKDEKQSVALSALHLSQNGEEQEPGSMHSVALSAFKVIETTEKPKNIEENKSHHSSNKSNTSKITPVIPGHESKSVQNVKERIDHSCQVIKGRDFEESNTSLRNDKSVALDPYKQDASIDPYKRDKSNQFRLSKKTSTDNTDGLNKRLQVSNDLTIQLKYHNKPSITSDTTDISTLW